MHMTLCRQGGSIERVSVQVGKHGRATFARDYVADVARGAPLTQEVVDSSPYCRDIFGEMCIC